MMNTETHCEQLAARLQTMANEEGLVDVKFFLNPSDEATKDVVCKEVNLLFRAMDVGDFYNLEFDDGTHRSHSL